jgi:hypothetical protein
MGRERGVAVKKIIGALGLLAAVIALHVALDPFVTYRGMAQVSNPAIISVSVTPSGACAWTLPLRLKTPDGTLFSCQNGTVGQIGGGSGGDTITSPNTTITVGGTSTATTLDINLAHANTWSATQTFGTATGNVSQFSVYQTGTNCASAASPAVCAAAASGSVAVPITTGILTVNTTRVTANSQIQLTFDSSLSARLGVTCTTTAVQPTVSARTAGTSFTITVVPASSSTPDCFSYTLVN